MAANSWGKCGSASWLSPELTFVCGPGTGVEPWLYRIQRTCTIHAHGSSWRHTSWRKVGLTKFRLEAHFYFYWLPICPELPRFDFSDGFVLEFLEERAFWATFNSQKLYTILFYCCLKESSSLTLQDNLNYDSDIIGSYFRYRAKILNYSLPNWSSQLDYYTTTVD